MQSILFSIPGQLALPAALVFVLFFVFLLREQRQFLIIFLLLILFRCISASDFILLLYAQTWLAVVLGSAKDFLFIAPFLFLTRFTLSKIMALITGAALIFLNLFDLIHIKETYFRLQQVTFENIDLAAILIRKDFLAIGLGAIGVCLFIFYLLFFKIPMQPANRLTSALIISIALASFALNPSPQIPKTGDYLTDEINMERDYALVIVADGSVRNLLYEALWAPPVYDRPIYEYSAEEKSLLDKFGVLGQKQANPLKAPAYDRVIYVFIESLSYDFLQCKALKPGAYTMPFYFSLLSDEKNIFLSNYYSSSFTTDEGIYAAFSSRPDFAGDDTTGRNPETIFSLARQRGYKSAYFMGASVYFRSKFKTYINTMQVDEIYGKEQTMDLPPQNTGFPWGDTDERIFEKALLWLTEHKEDKTITILCTINTHPPFYSQQESPPGIEDSPLTRAFYSTDKALETFVSGLKKEGLLDKKTLLIIGADHQITHGGEMVLNHLPQKKFGERRIPLVMISKNTAPLKKIIRDARSSAIDMAPTLGDLLALPEQPTYYGKSLFIPNRRYDLGMTRGGLFFFGTPEQSLSFDLRYDPEGVEQKSLYKWYFNQQQTAIRNQ